MKKIKKKPIKRLTPQEKIQFKKQFHKLAKNEITEIKKNAANELTAYIIAALAITARDELDFGKKRILKLEKRFLNQFNALVDGRITLQDIEIALKEECNIDFRDFVGDIYEK